MLVYDVDRHQVIDDVTGEVEQAITNQAKMVHNSQLVIGGHYESPLPVPELFPVSNEVNNEVNNNYFGQNCLPLPELEFEQTSHYENQMFEKHDVPLDPRRQDNVLPLPTLDFDKQ